MFPRIISPTSLEYALRAEGFDLPEDCVNVRLEMPITGRHQLTYTVDVRGEALAKLGRALVRIGIDDVQRNGL